MNKMRNQNWDHIEEDELYGAKYFRMMVENGTCVHSFYCENCNACRERELRRALAVLVDFHKEQQTKHPRGTVVKTFGEAWELAENILIMNGIDERYPQGPKIDKK